MRNLIEIREAADQSDIFRSDEPFKYLGESKRGYCWEIKDRMKSLWDSKFKIDKPSFVDYVRGRVYYKDKVENPEVDGRFFPNRVVARAKEYTLTLETVASAVQRTKSIADRNLVISDFIYYEDSINEIVIVDFNNYRGWFKIEMFDGNTMTLRYYDAKNGIHYSWERI